MDPNQEIEDIGNIADDAEDNDSVSVDDFIKQLEAREKDLHITADTTIIEIAESFGGDELPEFLTSDSKTKSIEPAAADSAPAKSKPSKADTAKLEREIAGLKETISQIQSERDELVKASLRRAKDFESYKTRTERERFETFQNQVGNLATQLLPVLDNLDRAVDFGLAMPDDRRNDIQQFLDGVVLVNQQVNEVLAEMGVQPIATVGEVFDPHFHEAVATEDSTDFEPNTVSAELLRGYRIGERVIRHSMVKVAKAPSIDEQEPAADDVPENLDESETDTDLPIEDLPSEE